MAVGPDINLLGIQALGLRLGTYIQELGLSKIVVGHDFRSYSSSITNALILGLISAGCEVHDIGLTLSPTAYFAQFDLDIPCVAMVTASHNENGWNGVKMGAQRPLTFGPDEMGRLRDIVLGGAFVERVGHAQGQGRMPHSVWFMSLDDARSKCVAERRVYNEHRPQSAIGDKFPIELASGTGPCGLSGP